MDYFRFRRSVKILPGIRLNIGKRGVSTSIGVREAHVTIGKTGTRTTVGLPGSGLSYTHLEKPHQAHQEARGEAQPPGTPTLGAAYYVGMALFATAIVWAIVAT